MKYIVTINDKSYEVEVEEGQASIVRTTEAVQIAPAASPLPQPQLQPQPTFPAAAAVTNGEQVKAPMPGVILNCKVAVGTKVKEGDIMFILEAMKMENEVMAPADGVVGQILVGKGSSVNTGDVLAVIQ
ncbi:MAG: Glutaconyl-CoA decarboxylase subunit gamma [Firmicutes bacterium ADurb.Bin193]|nr:MAG: Glutaconyl-CoA decarboxylase subunit gamma [Firmicutes bacterium ADurb.Bin193]